MCGVDRHSVGSFPRSHTFVAGNEVRQVSPDHLPDDLEIHVELVVHDPVSHPGNLAPRDVGPSSASLG
jgi:hypothetical protein